MVSTFSGRILRPACADQSDAQLERRLVGYLLDHQAEILAPPGHVREAVSERLRRRPRETVRTERRNGRGNGRDLRIARGSLVSKKNGW